MWRIFSFFFEKYLKERAKKWEGKGRGILWLIKTKRKK